VVLKFGSYNVMNFILNFINFTDVDDFDRVIFTDFTKCTRSVMFLRDFFSVIVSYLPKYVAAVSGINDWHSVSCNLKRPVATISLSVGLTKGSYCMWLVKSNIQFVITISSMFHITGSS